MQKLKDRKQEKEQLQQKESGKMGAHGSQDTRRNIVCVGEARKMKQKKKRKEGTFQSGRSKRWMLKTDLPNMQKKNTRQQQHDRGQNAK